MKKQTEKEKIKRKIINIIRERQAELCNELKRKFTDGVLFENDLKNFYDIMEELEVIKTRLWNYIK